MSSEEEKYTIAMDNQIQQEMQNLKDDQKVWLALLKDHPARVFKTEDGCDKWICYMDEEYGIVYLKQAYKLHP